jgi:ATP-dependent DNA helicase 2 subunit 2
VSIRSRGHGLPCCGPFTYHSIDIDDLFDEEVKGEPSTPSKGTAKGEPSQRNSDRKPRIPDDDEDMAEAGGNGSPVPAPAKPAKPKKGRLVSNEQPLEDFHRLVEGEGDVFRKAIQDLGAVVKENVEGSFSRSAFPLAIECLKAMRETALVYEEVETYNALVSLRSSGVVLHS